MIYCALDITKETVANLPTVPIPGLGRVLQVRSGQIKTLVNEPSGIFKTPVSGPVYVGPTGILADEHQAHDHGGTERALMAYDSTHYANWRVERCPKPALFDIGAFGENLVCSGLTEEDVCIGDVFRVGEEVLLEVSEPRNPCYKLNLRFEWPRALKRVTKTGRVGWMFRVKKAGYISSGDSIQLIQRPYPRWSCLNIKRAIQAKSVALPLLHELTQIGPLTEKVRNYGLKRLERTAKRYKLAASAQVSTRVKLLTFELDEPTNLALHEFPMFAFAQISFGGDKFHRSYSIVSGNMQEFSLGVALDDHSRGGSEYLHRQLKLGEPVDMLVGSIPRAIEDEETSLEEGLVESRLVIVGGIGITAFLPLISTWSNQNIPCIVHYAVRDANDAAFLDRLPPAQTRVYSSINKQRLSVEELIPIPDDTGRYTTRIYCCGPTKLMDAIRSRAEELKYPDRLLHFESFGTDADGPGGEPFSVDVNDLETDRKETLDVPANKSLLQTLRDAGFEMTALCEAGGCGACKVKLLKGDVVHKGTGLYDSEKPTAMLTCVSRGIGKIAIEID